MHPALLFTGYLVLALAPLALAFAQGRPVRSFWDELASISPRTAKVVQAYKDYTAVMEKVGVPYRYG